MVVAPPQAAPILLTLEGSTCVRMPDGLESLPARMAAREVLGMTGGPCIRQQLDSLSMTVHEVVGRLELAGVSEREREQTDGEAHRASGKRCRRWRRRGQQTHVHDCRVCTPAYGHI